MYLVSACLVGKNTKYNGGNNLETSVAEFASNHSVYLICPETAGNLPVPRDPAERQGNRIIDRLGKDVTENFINGAKITFDAALKEAEARGEKIEGAILKANSPSCGVDKIYDGTFSKVLVDGNGCFTEMLKKQGIKVITEKEFDRNGKF